MKKSLRSFLLVALLLVVISFPASANPVVTCQCYGSTLCCQTWYYTPAGWVPLDEPDWGYWPPVCGEPLPD